MAREEPAQLPVSWVGFDDLPVYYANQILVQSPGPGEIVVTFGQLTPPPVVGTHEEQREQMEQIPFVPVRPLVRLSLTLQRMKEFIAVMQAQQEQHEQALRRMNPFGEMEPPQ